MEDLFVCFSPLGTDLEWMSSSLKKQPIAKVKVKVKGMKLKHL